MTKNHGFDNIMSLFRGTSRLIFKNLEFGNMETRIYTKFLSHLLNTLIEVGMPYWAKAYWLSFSRLCQILEHNLFSFNSRIFET